jgi:hypothetical protein
MREHFSWANFRSKATPSLLGSGLLLLGLAGCGQPNSPEPRGTARAPVQQERGYGQSAPTGSSQQRRAIFLEEIRQADPSHQTVQRALLNENNELGVILSRNAEMDEVPALMRSLLARMAKQFPGQDLTVIAYAPSNPPIKIGTARLDARTRKMSYTPENKQRF